MAPPSGNHGVLPASVLQKHTPAPAPASRGPKPPQPRLKLLLRRLPPGLTKTELDTILGDEWKIGGGKVDAMVYKKGKISKDQSKPSKPSRAYIWVTSQSQIPVLGDHVRQLSFTDAARSSQDGALIGPPTLEFAPYHKRPGGRRKNDNRAGTIDQDQEFKDFLESLTNPITKPAPEESDGQKPAKITTTPLIEALREKKANKEKPQPKGGKHGRGEAKEEGGEKKILSKGGKEAVTPAEKGRRPTKAEKAAKEAVKVLNKEALSKESTPAPSVEKAASVSAAPPTERKRGNASIAKSMLQRDLGIGPGPTRRRGTKREVTPAASASTDASTITEDTAGRQKAKETMAPSPKPAMAEKMPASPKRQTRAERRAFKASLGDRTNRNTEEDTKSHPKAGAAIAPTILKKPQTPTTPTVPKGPAASRAPPSEPAGSRANAPQQSSGKGDATAPRAPVSNESKGPTVFPTSRQAFLKHANPSQGITEPLIEEALKVFGAVEKVEIDKRKGFAYVDFAEPEGLQKAIAANPVKIAQGAVQVLERKEKVQRRGPPSGIHGPHAPQVPHGPPSGPARGRGGYSGRGRGRGGARGGSHVANAASSAPAPAPVAANTPT